METQAQVLNAEAKPAVNENMIIALLAAINFTHIMDFVIMAPLNPILKVEFGITTGEFSFLVAVYNLSAGISGIISSFFIDRFDRKTAIITLYFGFVVSNLCCALASDFALFLISRIVAGFFGGILASLIFSVIGDVVPPQRRGKAMGIVMAAFSAASVIGIPIGLHLADTISWNAPFMLLTVLSGIVLLFCYRLFPSLTGHMTMKRNPPMETILSVLRNPNLLWSLSFTAMLMMAGFSVVPFVSDYLVANVGLSAKELRYVYFFGGLATAVSGPLVGRLADKFGKQRVFVIAAIVSIAPMIIITNLPQLSLTIVLVYTTVFFICFGARFVPAIAVITGSVSHQQRGSFMSINSSVQQLASAIAAFGAGLVLVNTSGGHVVNFNYVGYFACAAAVACIFISYKIKQVS